MLSPSRVVCCHKQKHFCWTCTALVGHAGEKSLACRTVRSCRCCCNACMWMGRRWRLSRAAAPAAAHALSFNLHAGERWLSQGKTTVTKAMRSGLSSTSKHVSALASTHERAGGLAHLHAIHVRGCPSRNTCPRQPRACLAANACATQCGYWYRAAGTPACGACEPHLPGSLFAARHGSRTHLAGLGGLPLPALRQVSAVTQPRRRSQMYHAQVVWRRHAACHTHLHSSASCMWEAAPERPAMQRRHPCGPATTARVHSSWCCCRSCNVACCVLLLKGSACAFPFAC